MSYISLYNETDITADNITVTGTVDFSNAIVIVNSISFGDGTALAPSVTFTADQDTGWYRSNSGELSFTSNGSQILFMNTNGLFTNKLVNITSNSNQLILGSSTHQCTINWTTALNETLTYTIPDCKTNSSFLMADYANSINSIQYFNNQIELSDGTNVNPSLCFQSAPRVGLYRNSGSSLMICSTSDVAQFNSGGIVFYKALTTDTAIFLTANSTQLSLGDPTHQVTLTFTASAPENITYLIPDCQTNSRFLMADVANQYISGTQYFNNQVQISDGTNTNPALVFQNETNTGIFRNGLGALSISSLGTEMFRIGSSQIQMFEALAMGSNTINCGNITTTGITWTGSNVNSAVYINGTNLLSNTASLTNGQLLIGSTGNAPALATLTGTTNQVIVTNGSNSITLSLPQSINTGASPTFNNLTLSGLTAGNYPVVTNGSKQLISSNVSGVYGIGVSSIQTQDSANDTALSILSSTTLKGAQFNVSNSDMKSFFTIWSGNTTGGSLSPALIWTAGTTLRWGTATSGQLATGGFSQQMNLTNAGLLNTINLNIGNLTGNSVLSLNSAKTVASNVLTNGQLLIGSTSNPAVVASLTGTTNQISVTNGAGSITLATPQNIHTGATPTFAGAFLNGEVVIGKTSSTVPPGGGTLVNTGLQLYGTDSSATVAPIIEAFTSADTYPLYQLYNYTHGTVVQCFDNYYDGANYRSSNVNSNYQISYTSNKLRIMYDVGVGQGSINTIKEAGAWDTKGNYSSSSQPLLLMNATTYQSVSNTTDTALTIWDTTIKTQGGILVASNSIFTVPTAGNYQVTVQVPFDPTTGGNTLAGFVYKNGSMTTRVIGNTIPANAGGDANMISMSNIVSLSASDTLTVGAWQKTGANLHIGTLSVYYPAYLSIAKLY